MKQIILAAGFATRLYPLTLDRSKCLLDINGKPIVELIISKIREISEEEIIVVTNDVFYNDFMKWKENSNIDKIKILNDGVKSLENKLGAIGDLLFAINEVSDDLFVISGDNLFDYSLKESYKLFKESKKDLSVFCDIADLNEAKRFGVASIKDGIISDYEEKPINPQSTICSTSTYFFRKETIPLMKLFMKEEKNHDAPGLFLQYLYKKVPVFAYITKGKWIDIGTHEALQKARREFKI